MKPEKKKSINKGTDLLPYALPPDSQTRICCFQFKCRDLSVFVVVSSVAIRNMASANGSAVLQTYLPCSHKTCLKEQTLECQSPQWDRRALTPFCSHRVSEGSLPASETESPINIFLLFTQSSSTQVSSS